MDVSEISVKLVGNTVEVSLKSPHQTLTFALSKRDTLKLANEMKAHALLVRN